MIFVVVKFEILTTARESSPLSSELEAEARHWSKRLFERLSDRERSFIGTAGVDIRLGLADFLQLSSLPRTCIMLLA